MHNLIIAIITTLLAILGASIGSFVNVAALRRSKGRGFLTGRSHCPLCNEVIKWYDLIPILSWLMLLGRCRKCKARVSPRYILVEITAAILFALTFMVYGFTLMTVLSLAVVVILLAIALIDLETMEIPNGLTIALIPLAIASVWVFPQVSLISRGIGFLAVSLPMLVIALVVSGAFGGGDIKLMAVCGFLLGWQNTLLAFFAAVVLGGGWAIYLMASGKRKRGEHMVFGPAICIGVFFALLFGEEILDWYLSLLFF